MGDRMQNILILVSALGSGLIAGAFFAFSSFVMGALGKLPASQGIAAMQSINVVVINPIFLGVLFGTAALALFLGFGAMRHLSDSGAIWIVAGTGSLCDRHGSGHHGFQCAAQQCLGGCRSGEW